MWEIIHQALYQVHMIISIISGKSYTIRGEYEAIWKQHPDQHGDPENKDQFQYW